MTAHRLGADGLLAANAGYLSMPTVKATATVKPDKNPAYVAFDSTDGAFTATISDPDSEGQWLILTLKTDAGDVTAAFDSAVNTTGNNRATFADAGDTQVLVSVHNGTSGYFWREVSNDGAALSTV